MGRIGKTFALLMILIVVMSCLTLLTSKPVSAQSISQPSIPEFTIQLVDHSYDIPSQTTTTIDQYTNKTTITTIPGQHVKNITIDLTIKNQNCSKNINGNTSNIYYNIRSKGHYGSEWQYYSSFPRYTSSPTSGQATFAYGEMDVPTQSNSEYTIISLPASYQVGDEVDFEVQAILGYQYAYWDSYHGLIPVHKETLYFQTSDWSQIKTFTVPANAQTPSIPELSWLVIVPLPLSLFIVALIVKHHTKYATFNRICKQE
jgi:hypothetical protein